MQRHLPPEGQLLVGRHLATVHCNCGPTVTRKVVQTASGRGGRHQGYAAADIIVQHNYLEG